GDQHISRAAPEIGHPDRGNVILARHVPQDEVHGALAEVHGLLVDLDPDRGQIGFRERTFHEPFDQAGLADGETAEHADLLLQHRLGCGHRYSSIPTVNETRRFIERAVSVSPSSRGSRVPALRTASRSGSTPRCFSSVRTASARARLSARLYNPVPVRSECPVKVTRVVTRIVADNAVSSFNSSAS